MNATFQPARPGPDIPAGSAEAASAFKDAMRHLAGGVSVITAAHGGEKGGLTATSLISLSAEPPSLLVSVNQGASSLDLVRKSGRFAVSLLGHDHSEIADRFAGRSGVRGAMRFEGADWIGQPGMPPVLDGAVASFECQVAEMLDRFSHTIIIGLVTQSRVREHDSGALVYWRTTYDRLGLLIDQEGETEHPGREADAGAPPAVRRSSRRTARTDP